jgi:hypothetical protein
MGLADMIFTFLDPGLLSTSGGGITEGVEMMVQYIRASPKDAIYIYLKSILPRTSKL